MTGTQSKAVVGLFLALVVRPVGASTTPKAALHTRPHPNVILITMDTLRADHVGCYGYKKVETPTLDALARDGIVFDRAIAQVPLTWPSHAVILTGTYPFQNGVQDFTGHPLDPQFRSVAQAFKQAGYATGAVVSSFVLDRSWGLARGFDFYDDAFSATAFQQKDLALVDRKAEESVTRALKWLNKTPKRPFFLWLHLYDPHSPYDPPEPYRTRYRDHLYDGEIAYADHELGRLMAWLKGHRLYENSVVVFLSDHGESLGDHGEQQHGFFIYNSTVRVPLIVKPPAAGKFPPSRMGEPVETVALAPTLLRAAGIADVIEKQFQANDLLASSRTGTAYSETFYPFSSFGWSPLHGLQTDRYHYIDAPEPELFDITSDPEEQTNLAPQQTATAAVLKEKLHQLLAKNPFNIATNDASGMPSDAAEQLRALGYLAYHSPVSKEALAAGLPDPKNKLWELNSILGAEDAMRAGDRDKGRTLLLQVQDKDPDMYVVPFLLGEAALGEQKWEEASAELKKCLALNPQFDQAMLGLARAFIFQGKADEAKHWAQQAIQYNPQNYRAWYQLGFIEAATDKQAAIADYEKAVSIQSNFAPLRRDLGLLQFQEANFQQAAQHLSAAVALGMDDAPLYNSLGISYSRIGRLQLAVETYRKALNLDPNLAEAHLNLGFALERLGQKAAAGQEYQQACELKADLCEMIRQHSR